MSIRSASFVGRASLPTVLVGGTEAVATRADDSTLSVRLPVLPTQSATLAVLDGLAGYQVGTVQIRGLRTTDYPSFSSVPLWGTPTFVRVGAAPFAIGAAFQPGGPEGTLGLLSPRTGQISTYPGLRYFRFDVGPGQSYVTGNLILHDAAGNAGEWRVLPDTAFVAAAPNPPGVWSTIRLSPTTWLHADKQKVVVQRDGLPDVAIPTGQAVNSYLSAPADRALLTATQGSPVFAMSTGEVAYSLVVAPARSAAFTDDGTALFVSGDSARSAPVLQRIDPVSGAVQASIHLADIRETGIAVNSSGTLLFLVGEAHGKLTVQIRDAVSLEQIGELESNTTKPCTCDGFEMMSLMLDEERKTLFVIESGVPTRLFQFDVTSAAIQ